MHCTASSTWPKAWTNQECLEARLLAQPVPLPDALAEEDIGECLRICSLNIGRWQANRLRKVSSNGFCLQRLLRAMCDAHSCVTRTLLANDFWPLYTNASAVLGSPDLSEESFSFVGRHPRIAFLEETAAPSTIESYQMPCLLSS